MSSSYSCFFSSGSFTDGRKLVPNKGMRHRLIAVYGKDTDAYVGHTITIRLAESVVKATGEIRYAKRITECSPIVGPPVPLDLARERARKADRAF